MASEIHSVIFIPHGKMKWTADKSRKWLSKHNLTPIKRIDKVYVDNKLTQLRYRIRDPLEFKRFITKKTNDDINFVIGFRK